MTVVLWVLVAVALAGTLLHPEGAGLGDGFALLVFPLTLAGSVVLT